MKLRLQMQRMIFIDNPFYNVEIASDVQAILGLLAYSEDYEPWLKQKCYPSIKSLLKI